MCTTRCEQVWPHSTTCEWMWCDGGLTLELCDCVGRSRAVKLTSHESEGESQIWEQAAINTGRESRWVPWTQCGEDSWLTLSPVRRKHPRSLCCHNNSQQTRCMCDLTLILEDQMFSDWTNQIIIKYKSQSVIYSVSLSSFPQCEEAAWAHLWSLCVQLEFKRVVLFVV